MDSGCGTRGARPSYWFGSVLALVFGYVAQGRLREGGEVGGGMADAG